MKRADIIAKQLEELAKRHRLTVDDLKEKWEKTGGDRVTFHRIATAKAKGEPKAENLRKIAILVGETRDQAFPEDDTKVPAVESIIVPDDPGVVPSYGLKAFRETSPELRQEVENFIRYANRRAVEEAQALKKAGRAKKSK